jgi:hypothetical protein
MLRRLVVPEPRQPTAAPRLVHALVSPQQRELELPGAMAHPVSGETGVSLVGC